MSEATGDTPDPRYHLEAADRTITLLEAVGDNSPITVVGLTNLLGWSKPMVYRLVRTLASAGALTQSEHGYALGPRMISLGYSALHANRLVDRARPILLQIHDETRETVVVTVLDGRDIVYVDYIETDHLMVLRAHIGTRLPAYNTASGHALLSGHSAQELAKLFAAASFERVSHNGVASLEALTERVGAVAESGLAVIDEELTAGHRAAASPVLDASGAVVAAMSISVPAARVSIAQLMRMAHDSLVPGARRLSAELGYRTARSA